MTESDGSTLGVDLLLRDTELVGTPQALAGESLVDLVDVDIVAGDAGALKGLGDGLPGTLTHEEGLDADERGSDELANDGLAELLGDITAHQQNGGGTVGDLTGVTGVDGTIFGKGGAELSKGLGGDTGTDTLILGNGNLLDLTGLEVFVLDGERRDFLVKETLLLGLEGLLLRSSSESVLRGTGDLEITGHVLRELAHGNLAVGSLLEGFHVLGEVGNGLGAVVLAHALNTGTDTDVDLTSADLVGNVDASLETRRALTVEGADSDRLGEASVQAGGAHLSSTTTGGKDSSNADILNESGVDLGSFDGGLEDTSHDVGGGGVLEGTLASTGEGASASSGDNDIVGALLEDLVLTASGRVASDLATNLRDTVEGYESIGQLFDARAQTAVLRFKLTTHCE